MPAEKTCPTCGKPMTENALMGLCPDCLLRAGFGTIDSRGETAEKPAPFVPPTPEELARYFPELEIIELLGRGGMGAVYKVRQKRLERLVALKILPPNVGQDPSFAERFEREAKALAQLHHPNIVTLYDSGQVDGLFYFFMEFVDGMNLRQMLDTGHISPREALAIVPQICDALQFAHDRGIIHRDIKPENILLNKEGRVKIADFGVAKIVAHELSETTGGGTAAPELGRTEAGKVIGTPQYMAPEQLSHPLDVDNRADIYALGVVFYQMLTGELPVGKFERPSSKAQIDVRLDEVVLRALEKKPELRYQQVSEVKTMVETIASSADIPTVGPGVAPGSASGRTDALRFSRRMAIMVVALALFLLTVLWSEFASVRQSAWALNLFAVLGIGSLLFSRLWRATKPPLKGAPAGLVANPTRLNKKPIWGLCAVFSAILFVNLCQWLKNYEPEGVWIPNAVDASVSSEYGEALIHVTEVSQNGQIVLIKLACDTPYPERGLYVEYSGQVFDYPAGVVSSATNVDCLLAPHFMSGYDKVLAGTTLLKGKPIYQIGFILPDAATAAKVVEQVKRVHLGKPRGLDQNKSSLLLFSLHRYVGEKASGEPVREGLDGMLIWQPKQNSIANSSVAETSHSEPNAVRQIKNAPFVARLNQGEVELAAIGNMPWTNPVCWLPDGQPSAAPFPLGNNFAISNWAENMEIKKIAFYIRNESAEGISNPICRISQESGAQPGSSAWDAPDSRTPNGHFAQIIVCPKGALTMNISLGVANGTWETAITLKHENNFSGGEADGDWSATWQAVTGKEGDVAVSCSYKKNEDWESRMVYVDDTEKVIPIQENSSHVGNGQTGATLPVSSSEFARIKEFRLQRRKYQWVEFRNVSLQPGHATTVEVKDFGGENQSAPIMSTTPAAAQNLTFGPVMERTLYDYKSGKDWLLNLETGETFSLPAGVDWDRNASAVWEWMHQHGIHVMGFTAFSQHWHEGDPVPVIQTLDHGYGLPVASKRGLYGFEMKAAIIQKKDIAFETITPLQISNALQWQVSPANGNSNAGPWLSQFAGMAWHDVAWHGLDDYLYAFQTDDGQGGVLQITGFTENPRAVKIRYKVVQSSVTTVTPVSLPPANAQNPSFGPVIERTIYDYKSGKDWLLNLETGESFSLPPGLDWDRNAAAVWEWAHQHGVHVTGLPVVSQQALYGFEMKAAIVREPNLTFEAITPLQISKALQGPLVTQSSHNDGPILFQLAGMDWQNLYAFLTNDGQSGLLQVIGMTENPPGVKIRYKVVLSSVTTVTPLSLPPADAQSPSFGPVMEHVLPADKDGLTPLFDLDHDKLVPDPGPGDTTGGLARLFSSGVAVMRDEAKGQTVLMGMGGGTVTESVRPEQWDTMTAAEAALLAMNSFLGHPGMGVITSAVAPGKLPQTFLFKTSSGKIGLWQVEEFTDNPHSVKIRYKLVQNAVETGNSLSWLLEEKPPIVSAMKNPVETPHFPLAGEAVGFADFDGEFHPVMFLAAPIPRGGSEVPASSLPPSRDSTLTLDIYRGTNPLATANHFLGEFQITTPSADAGLEIGFRLTQSGQLYLDVSDRDKNVTLEGNRIRAADPTDKQNTIRYKLVR